ncbi:SprT-like domain-containing protein [Brevibacillus porteri]|uniref:SprT-like domain-containing protein n=1 Tax=Brevibacillus porteri TaxID=2126350 RepID=UPI00363D242A
MTLEWIQEQAKVLVMKHWGLDFIPEIVIDSDREYDWSTCRGLYWNNTQTIEFNSKVNETRTRREIKKTLLHELCHWYLHYTGQPFRDSDERFARELIRVGIGGYHNRDEKSVKAAKLAKKRKHDERFEIYESIDGDVITTRLRHSRKNQDDFKRDLGKTLMRMHNEQFNDGIIYAGDVADMLCEWYGYKVEPLAVYGIELSNDRSYGGIGDRDDISHILNELGFDKEEIEDNLMEHENV